MKGQWACIDTILTQSTWSIGESNTAPKYVASNTGNAEVSVPGVRGWTGTVSGKGYPGKFPGASFSFIGYEAPANGISGNGNRYSGNAIVESLTLNWNWANGDPIGYELGFGGSGPLTRASGTQILDSSVPTLFGSNLGAPQFSLDGTDWDDFEAAVSASVAFTTAGQTNANSGTAGWQERVAGPLSGTFTLVTESENRQLTHHSLYYLRFPLDGSNYFQIKTGRFLNYSNIQFDRTTNKVVQQTLNLVFNAHDGTSLGHVKNGASFVWGNA